MNKLVFNASIILTGILFCSTVSALGPPGAARNGGTGSGVNNSYEQLAISKISAPLMQRNTLAATQDQKPKQDNYPRYVNVIKVSDSFVRTSP